MQDASWTAACMPASETGYYRFKLPMPGVVQHGAGTSSDIPCVLPVGLVSLPVISKSIPLSALSVVHTRHPVSPVRTPVQRLRVAWRAWLRRCSSISILVRGTSVEQPTSTFTQGLCRFRRQTHGPCMSCKLLRKIEPRGREEEGQDWRAATKRLTNRSLK